MSSILLKIKRGETPFYRWLRETARRIRSSALPLPGFLNPLLRLGFHAQQGFMQGLRWALSYFLYQPLFRARCLSVGKRFSVWRMPFVMGHAIITIGDDVSFFGKVGIFSGRQFDEPRLVIGNHVNISHNVLFTVNKEIVIEDYVNISLGVRMMDTDSHPRDAMARSTGLPAPPEEIRPIRIGRHAWIGQSSFIMKGVTIGEGAIIGVNSVVVNDIPAYSVAIGNPARVVVKNINRTTEPSTRAAPLDLT